MAQNYTWCSSPNTNKSAVASGIMMSSKKKNEASDDKMTFAFLALNTESISIKPFIVSTDCSDDLV